jgi:hypothetical protein
MIENGSYWVECLCRRTPGTAYPERPPEEPFARRDTSGKVVVEGGSQGCEASREAIRFRL